MSTTTVGPGEFVKAAAAAAPGDYLDLFGVQDLGGRYVNTKHLILTNGAAQRATLLGAITDKGGLAIDAGTDPFNGLLLDDNTPIDSVGRPSWINNGPAVEWRGVELTNRHSKIGMQPNDYLAGGGNGFQLRFFYIHAIGKLYTSQAAAGAQALLRKDGSWIDNHEHGLYGSGQITGSIVEDGIIEDCADRGMQWRSGVSGARIRRVLIRACGMGFMYGDPCSDVHLEDSILLDNLATKRGLLEEYNTGAGNGATNVVAFNRDGRKAVLTSSVKLTNVREIDPLYDVATRKLAAASPALGLGPSFIQPAAPAPAPTPVPAPTVNVAVALAATRTAISELELSAAWKLYASTPTSHTYKSHAAMLAARRNLGGT